METVNNMANAAAKAVWGEGNTKEEPVSGQTGNVSQGEPYDAGNRDAPSNTASADTSGSGAAASTTQGSSNTMADNSGSGNAASAPTGSSNAAGDNSGSGAPASATKDSSHTAGDSTASQGDVRHPSDPSTDPDKAHQRSNVDDSSGGMDKDQNPQKVDGPGPAPIDQVAKAHGGDAGKAKSNESVNEAGKEGGADGNDDDEEDGPQKKSHGEGTGEKYIKSSGLQADGGDFDAANAGAGREADRLLEEKGIHHDGDNHGKPQQTNDAPSAGGTAEKRSLGDTLKAHLHKNKQQH